MMYNSTTDKNLRVSAAQAIAQGISEDGGLFVPSEIPKYSEKDMKDLLKMDYRGRAKKILRDYLSGFTAEEVDWCVEKAYTKENSVPIIRRRLYTWNRARQNSTCWSCGTAQPARLRIWRSRFCPIFDKIPRKDVQGEKGGNSCRNLGRHGQGGP